MPAFKDVFISYGRKESLAFATKLFHHLEAEGIAAWFDHVNIPKGDDFQQRIDDGIRSAHNFIFIIAPHANASPFCLKEIELAIQLNKRIIPILHIERDLSQIHPIIGKINWIYARQKEEIGIPLENWENIDDFDAAFKELQTLIEFEKEYVEQHTAILLKALEWKRNQKQIKFLLVGKERIAALEWLLSEFIPPKQPPCLPTLLHTEFISESRKNAENLMTDCFLCFDSKDQEVKTQVSQALARYGITTWSQDQDLDRGSDFTTAFKKGIEQADNFLFFISLSSVVSKSCEKEFLHALELNKRVIPILIETIDFTDTNIPETIQKVGSWKFVDFSDNAIQGDFHKDIDEIINLIRRDQEYYLQHKVLLTKAIRWQQFQKKTTFLLRGFNLENANTWFRLNKDRNLHPPTPLHQELIEVSEALKGQLATEVFISYSRHDSDIARLLNNRLQEAGKTTWFDQENIAVATDFQQEIYKGIESSDNFVFLISPDSIQSPYCQEEVEYAKRLNKRFITLLVSETNSSGLPKELAEVQWLDFIRNSFDKSFSSLIQTLEIDREYVQAHTQWQQRATEWEEHQKSDDFLLNITACSNAQNWLSEALGDINLRDDFIEIESKKTPSPTQLQVEFIKKSQQAILKAQREQRDIQTQLRVRLRRGRMALGAAIVLLGIAIYFIFLSSQNQRLARKRANEVQATSLAFQAKKILASDPNRALAMATQAYELQENPSPSILQALSEAYYEPIAQKHPFYIAGHTEENVIEGLQTSQSGKVAYIVRGNELEFEDDTIKVFDASNRLSLWHQFSAQKVSKIQFSPNDSRLLVNAQTPFLINLQATDSSLLRIDFEDSLTSQQFQFFENGRNLMSYNLIGDIQIWNPENGELIKNVKGSRVNNNEAIQLEDSLIVLRRSLAALQKADSAYEASILTRSQKTLDLKEEMDDMSQQMQQRQSGKRISQKMQSVISQKAIKEQGIISKELKSLQYRKDKAQQQQRLVVKNIQKLERQKELLLNENANLESVKITQNGRYIFLFFSTHFLLIETQTTNTIERFDDEVFLSISNKSRVFLTKNNNGRIILRSCRTGKVKERLDKFDGTFHNISFSPNDQWIAAISDEGKWGIWETAKGRLARTASFGMEQSVMKLEKSLPLLSFSQNSSQVAFSFHNTTQLISLDRLNTSPIFLNHKDLKINHLDFTSVNEQLIIQNSEETLIYDFSLLEADEEENMLAPSFVLPFAINELAFTNKQQSLVGIKSNIATADFWVKIWDIHGTSNLVFPPIQDYAISQTAQLGASFFKDTIEVNDLWTDTLKTILTHDLPLIDIQFSAKGNRLIGQDSINQLVVWDLSSQEKLLTINPKQRQLSNYQLSPKGEQVLINWTDGQVVVWKVEEKEPAFTLFTSKDSVSDINYAENGNCIIGLENSYILKVWDSKDGKVKYSFDTEKDSFEIQKFCLSSDNQTLAYASDDAGIIWVRDLRKRKPALIASLNLDLTEYVQHLEISNNNRFLLVFTNQNTKLWDIRERRWRYNIQVSSTLGLAASHISPNSRSLLLKQINDDLTKIRLIDLNSRQLIFEKEINNTSYESQPFLANNFGIIVGNEIFPTPEGIANWVKERGLVAINNNADY